MAPSAGGNHFVHISAGSGFVPNWSIIKHAMHHGMKLSGDHLGGAR